MNAFTTLVGSKRSLFYTSNRTAGTFNNILTASIIMLSPQGYNKSAAK
jgi:hypothetical protein